MASKRTALAPRDPFTLLRQMTSDLDRMFESSVWPSFRWPSFRTRPAAEAATWFPEIDVFEKDNRLVRRLTFPA